VGTRAQVVDVGAGGEAGDEGDGGRLVPQPGAPDQAPEGRGGLPGAAGGGGEMGWRDPHEGGGMSRSKKRGKGHSPKKGHLGK